MSAEVVLALRKWFFTDLIWPRSLRSIGFSLGLFYLTISCVAVFVHLDIFRPFGSVLDGIFSVVSLSSIAQSLCASLLYFLCCVVSYKSPIDQLSRSTPESPLKQLMWRCFRHGTIFILFPLISWWILKIWRSSFSFSVVFDQETQSYHLHIPFVFIHLSTMATVLHYLIESRNLQAWVNEIPQSTLTDSSDYCQVVHHFKSRLIPGLWQALQVHTVIFLLFTAGGTLWLHHFFASLFSAELSATHQQFFGVVWELLSVKLLVVNLISQTFISQFLNLILDSFRVYMSENYCLPIPDLQCVNDPNLVYLPLGLMCEDMPLLKRLAFRDFCHLADHSVFRRSRLFAVSQPGSHPRNWNDLVAICTGQLEKLRLGLEKSTATLSAQSNVNSYHRKMMQKQMFLTSFEDPNQSTGPIDPGVTLNRSLSETKAFGNVAKVESSTEPSLSLKGILHLGQLPIDPVSERFTDLNIDIWNISGLASLLQHSYTEDQYGVAQKDIGRILGGLCDVQTALEKLCRLTGNFPPRPGNEDPLERKKLRLHVCVDSALIKIISTFGPALRTMALTPAQNSALRRYTHETGYHGNGQS